MKSFPEARAAIWRFKRAVIDLRLAMAESKVSKLRLKLALMDALRQNETVDDKE